LVAGDIQQVNIETDKFVRKLSQAIEVAVRKSRLDSDVLAFDIAQFLQRLPESLIRRPRRRLVPNEAQTGQLRRLLCLDGKWQPNKSQCDQTYGQKDVAFHSRLQRYKRGIVLP
jgi:hypothetical protein